ncbi:manganese catalase family protein [Salmonella enterica subsp. enterica]|nr:manganese catalase family protein [Salmonella enterica subsp. enterica]
MAPAGRTGGRLPLLHARLGDDDAGRREMLMDIATEELSHLEHRLTGRNA